MLALNIFAIVLAIGLFVAGGVLTMLALVAGDFIQRTIDRWFSEERL